MAITWQVMAGVSWSTVRLCSVVGTGEVKNKQMHSGCCKGSCNLPNSTVEQNKFTAQPHCRPEGKRAPGVHPHSVHVSPSQLGKVLSQGAQRWVGQSSVPTALGPSTAGTEQCLGWGGGGCRVKLEPSPADRFSMKYFWLCRNSPCGSRLTFTVEEKLIHGVHSVG